MTKILLGFQLIVAAFLHVVCCGFPLLLWLGSSLGVFVMLQTFTPFIVAVQIVVFAIVLYRLYWRVDKDRRKSISRRQHIVFWVISIVSLIIYLYPPAHWFRSEEERLKQVRIERFLNKKQTRL